MHRRGWSDWNPDHHDHLSRARDHCFRQCHSVSKSESWLRRERSSRLVDRTRGDTSVTEENLDNLRELVNDLEIEKDRRFLLATILAHACNEDAGTAVRAIKAEVDSATRAFHFKSFEVVAAADSLLEDVSSAGGGVETVDESETEPQPKKRPRR